ncbi:MAG: hypothetical protein AAFY74_20580 [Pseudomonadota bacterium]
MDLQQFYYQTNRLLSPEIDAFDDEQQALASQLSHDWAANKDRVNPNFHELYENRLAQIERKAQRQ